MGILLTSLLFSFQADADSPPNGVNKPTPAQLQTAEIAAARTTAETVAQAAQIEISKVQNQSNWQSLYSFLGGSGFAAMAAILVYLMKTRQSLLIEKENHDAALRKDGIQEDNTIIVGMRAEIQRLQERIAASEKREASLQEQLNRQSEQLLWMQMTGNDSAFIGWSVDTQYIVTHVTAAFERQILNPLSMTRGQVIGKKHSDIWPAQLASAIAALDDAARISPDHSAWGEGIIFDPRLPPFMVGKTVLRFNDRPIGLSGIAIAMRSRVAANGALIPKTDPQL